MSDIWFSADAHYGHRRMVEQRGFESKEEMDAVLIERWNKTVKSGDTVYFLGDFSFRNKTETEEVIDRLQGTTHFIRGNHDHVAAKLAHRFASFQSYEEVKIGEQRLVLFHYPIASYNGVHKGSWHLHGHSHGSAPETDMARLDVGVDTHDLYPWHLDEISEILATRNGLPGDHHTHESD